MINKTRSHECFWLFSNTLPIGKNQTDKLVKAFGENVAVIIPDLLAKIGTICLNYPEEFEGYLAMLQHMILYIREETDDNPIESIDIPEEEKQKLMKHMEIQLGNRKSK